MLQKNSLFRATPIIAASLGITAITAAPAQAQVEPSLIPTSVITTTTVGPFPNKMLCDAARIISTSSKSWTSACKQGSSGWTFQKSSIPSTGF